MYGNIKRTQISQSSEFPVFAHMRLTLLLSRSRASTFSPFFYRNGWSCAFVVKNNFVYLHFHLYVLICLLSNSKWSGKGQSVVISNGTARIAHVGALSPSRSRQTVSVTIVASRHLLLPTFMLLKDARRGVLFYFLGFFVCFLQIVLRFLTVAYNKSLSFLNLSSDPRYPNQNITAVVSMFTRSSQISECTFPALFS